VAQVASELDADFGHFERIRMFILTHLPKSLKYQIEQPKRLLYHILRADDVTSLIIPLARASHYSTMPDVYGDVTFIEERLKVANERLRTLAEIDQLLVQKAALVKNEMGDENKTDEHDKLPTRKGDGGGGGDDDEGKNALIPPRDNGSEPDTPTFEGEPEAEEEYSDGEYVPWPEKTSPPKKPTTDAKMCTRCGFAEDQRRTKDYKCIRTQFSGGSTVCDICRFGFEVAAGTSDEPIAPTRRLPSPREKLRPKRYDNEKDEDEEDETHTLVRATTSSGKRRAKKRRLNDEHYRHIFTQLAACACERDPRELECMRNMLLEASKGVSNPYQPWHSHLPCVVARDGRTPRATLEYLLNQGAYIDYATFHFASERKPDPMRRAPDGTYESALEVLKFLYQKKSDSIDMYEVLYQAVYNGQFECVMWIIENVPGMDVAKWPSNKTPSGKDNELMLVAAQMGEMVIFKYLYDANCDFSVEDAQEAVVFVSNRDDGRRPPLRWRDVVTFIQTTDEWKRISDRNVTGFT
jgi:hypothetical protein